MHGTRPDEAMLHAYVDQRLTPPEREVVEAYLAGHPDEAARIADYRAQNEALQALGALLAAAPAVPTPGTARRGRRWRPAALRLALQVAAALVLVAVGGATGWWLRGTAQPGGTAQAMPAFARRAVAAHTVYVPEKRHPVEVTAAQEQHLVRWLSNRLGTTVQAPHLGDLGFTLVGGRLLPAEHGPAGQFMYEDAEGRRLTLYLIATTGDSKESAFRYRRRQGVGVFYWKDGVCDYALAGDLPRAQLLDIATAVYHRLER